MPGDHNAPTTKQDLQDLRNQVIEAMRDMQTEVLRAFHNWASPTDIKIRSHEERITMLEERLREIEGGRLTKH
jgi:hypothetical protein